MQWRVVRSQADHIRDAHPRQISKQSLVDTSRVFFWCSSWNHAETLAQFTVAPQKTVIKSLCSNSTSQQLVAYVINLKLITSTHHLLLIADVLLPACDCLSTTAGRFRRLWRVEVSQGPSVQRSAIFAASCGVQSQKSEQQLIGV